MREIREPGFSIRFIIPEKNLESNSKTLSTVFPKSKEFLFTA